MFETVVVATDGSGTADRAVGTALSLAEAFDADLHAVSVVESDPGAADVARTPRDEAERAVERVADAADREVRTAVREGEPAAAISEYAGDSGAEVMVMGTRGRGGSEFHLGSVAERVVERCPVPVMTVRGREDGGAEGAPVVGGDADDDGGA